MLLLCLLLVVNLSLSAYAAGSVTYDGNAKKFIFLPGSELSPTDLFTDLKNVMPGDTLTDQVTIRGDISKKIKIKVYLRSLGAQEDTDKFLSQMKLKVVQKNATDLFEAPSDQTAQLTDWVYLGTLYSGGEVTLDLTLEVPVTMGNEFRNQTGYIDWEFKVEEIPIPDSDGPKTGDAGSVFLYAGVMALSLGALMLLLYAQSRRRRISHN